MNPLYLIVSVVEEYVEEKNGNTYFFFASTDKNKEVLERYTEICDKTKSLIKKISDKQVIMMKNT